MLTTMTDFDTFMTGLATLPPMGATPAQSDLAFWREIDAMQAKEEGK